MEHVGDQRVQIGLGHIVIARVQVEGGTGAGLAARQVSLVTLPRVEESRPSLILDGNVKILPGLGDIRIPILPMGKGAPRPLQAREAATGEGLGRVPRQSSWRKEKQFFSARLGAPQRVNEPTHLGADGRYDEDESPSPVHEKKQARTRGRSSTRLFTRGRHAHGEERHTHTHVSGRGWSRGVDE